MQITFLGEKFYQIYHSSEAWWQPTITDYQVDTSSPEGSRFSMLERNSYFSVEQKPGWWKIKELQENQYLRLIAASDAKHLINMIKKTPSDKN